MDHANRHPRFILVLAILSAMMSGSSGTLYAQRTTAFEGGPVTMCLDSVRPNRLISCGGGILAKRKFTDATFFKEYAGDLTIGNTIAFNFGEQTSVYSELVGAYMHLGRLGYARAGFGALVAASDDSTASTAEQFFDGGGNASFYMALPLYYHLAGVRTDSTATDRGTRFLSRRLDFYLVSSIGADLPTLNVAATDRAGVFQIGPQLSLAQNATDDAIRVFVQLGGGVAVGTQEFYTNAEVDHEGGSPFAFGQATFGIDLSSLIRIAGTVGGSTIGEISRPLSVSVQLLPRPARPRSGVP